MKSVRIAGTLLLAGLVLTASGAFAREAAFVDPGMGGGGDESVKVEPKSDVDVGETGVGVAKRTSLFFVNQTRQPIKIEKVVANGDGNVSAELTSDDCTKQGAIAPLSRCSVEVSITPTSSGSWNAEVLMTYDGAGRIARAKLSGKSGGSLSEKREQGLSFSTKEISPVNFGDVNIGDGKAVRSALMVNDSAQPITLYSIDVIEASNGLRRLDQGCAVDMELKPGESCPVTLLWTPMEHGQISTDLIIRHSGKLGFAVIPIRGTAKGDSSDYHGDDTASSSRQRGRSRSADAGVPPPPSARDLEKLAAGGDLSLPSSAMGRRDYRYGGGETPLLIGTVGNRAVLQVADGSTVVVGVGEETESAGKTLKVLSVSSKTVAISVGDKKKTLALGASPELIRKAQEEERARADKTKGAQRAPELKGGGEK